MSAIRHDNTYVFVAKLGEYVISGVVQRKHMAS